MIAALVIVAGRKNPGDYDNLYEDAGAIPPVVRIIKTLRLADMDRIVVVCDEDDSVTEKQAAFMDVVFLRNQRGAGMRENIQLGLMYVRDKYEAVLITPVDVPLFSTETVQMLVSADKPIGIPYYKGNPGYPVFLRAAYFPAAFSYAGGDDLAKAAKTPGMEGCAVEVEDEGVLANIYDEKDYTALLARHSLADIRPEIRIRIVREKAFYGPGAHQLLQLIDEAGSLRKACRQMGISYSKGRGIIGSLEQQLGCPVLESGVGGKDGGYSSVTDDGKELIRCYTAFSTEVKQNMQTSFQKHFHRIGKWS